MIDHINYKLKHNQIVLLHKQRTVLIVRDVNPPIQHISWMSKFVYGMVKLIDKFGPQEKIQSLRSYFTLFNF